MAASSRNSTISPRDVMPKTKISPAKLRFQRSAADDGCPQRRFDDWHPKFITRSGMSTAAIGISASIPAIPSPDGNDLSSATDYAVSPAVLCFACGLWIPVARRDRMPIAEQPAAEADNGRHRADFFRHCYRQFVAHMSSS